MIDKGGKSGDDNRGPDKRRAYATPAVLEEEIFERLALQACGKLASQPFSCVAPFGSGPSS